MTMAKAKKEDERLDSKETDEMTFRCRFCERSKPVGEMMVLARFFPPLVACRDCEKKMR